MSDIKRHMEIISLCGCLVGTVDHIEGGAIKLTRSPYGQHHFIPTECVAWVDECVHLNKAVFEAKYVWKSDAAEIAGPAIVA